MIDREIGPYRVQEPIPFRGAGKLFAGVHAVLGRRVAIRELPCDAFADPVTKERFLRAARIVQRHAPRHVASVHLCQETAEAVLLVTEFFPGTLEERLVREEEIPLAEALGICRAVLHGVSFLHGNGIVHGDIGAHNVAFAQDGSAKLMGWGGINRRPGTVGDDDCAGDLRAVGALLQRLVRDEVAGAGAESGTTAPEPVRPAVAAVIARALAPDPGDCFATAQEFLAALPAVPEDPPAPAEVADRRVAPLLSFPGRSVPWALLFGLMAVPLFFASMTRKSALPEVPHGGAVVAGSESDASPGGPLPGLLPVQKERPKASPAALPQKKERGRKGAETERKE